MVFKLQMRNLRAEDIYVSYNRKLAAVLERKPGIFDSKSTVVLAYRQELVKMPCNNNWFWDIRQRCMISFRQINDHAQRILISWLSPSHWSQFLIQWPWTPVEARPDCRSLDPLYLVCIYMGLVWSVYLRGSKLDMGEGAQRMDSRVAFLRVWRMQETGECCQN